MAETPHSDPTELTRPDCEEINALRPDDFVLVSQWAPDPAGPEDHIWLRVVEAGANMDPGEPFTIKGTVCCWPLPDAVQQGEERIVFDTDVLAVIRKEDLPDARLEIFFRRPGPEHDAEFKAEFRRLRDGEKIDRDGPEIDPESAEWLMRDGGDEVVPEEPVEAQIVRLSEFIMTEVPGEPSTNEGAIDCAIRIIRTLMALDTFAVSLQAVHKLFYDEQRLSLMPGADGLGGDLERRTAVGQGQEAANNLRRSAQGISMRLQCLQMVPSTPVDPASVVDLARSRVEFVLGIDPLGGDEIRRRGIRPDIAVRWRPGTMIAPAIDFVGDTTLGEGSEGLVWPAGETVPLYQLSGVGLDAVEAVIRQTIPNTGGASGIEIEIALGYIAAAREERHGTRDQGATRLEEPSDERQ